MRFKADNSGIGHRDDKIIYETGHVAGDNLILDGSSSIAASNTPSNISILLESGSQPDGYDYDVAYLILNSSDGFNDEGGKLDVEAGSITDEYDNILAEDGNLFALEDGFIKQGDDILFEGTVVDNEVAGGVMKAESAHNGVGGQNEKTLAKVHNVKLSVKPKVRQNRNLLRLG